jgi:hypothetical protein
MGLVKLKCLKCGKIVEIDRSLIDQRFTCPECKTPFEVKDDISSNTYYESNHMSTSHDSSTNFEKSRLDAQQKSFDSYKQHNSTPQSIEKEPSTPIFKGFGQLLLVNQKEHLKRLFSHFGYILTFIVFFFFLLWFLGAHFEFLGKNYTYPICSLFPRIDCSERVYTYSNFIAMVSGLLYFSLTFGMLWCLFFNDKFSIYGGEYLWLFTLIRLPHLPYTSLYSYVDGFLFYFTYTYQLSSFFCWCMNCAFILPFLLIGRQLYFSKDKQAILVRFVGSLLFNFIYIVAAIIVIMLLLLWGECSRQK